jgi:hypothetical protein
LTYCAVLSVMLVCEPAQGERLFLVVAASAASPTAIAVKAKALAPKAKNALIVQTSDCKENRNVFAFVTSVSDSREAAQAALGQAKAIISDAYVKSCDVRRGSTLDLRIPAVDASIADVPSDAVNWTDEDRISTAEPLPDGRFLVIARYYVSVPDDPLEGRRERVILAESADKKTVLDNQCANPSSPSVDEGRIAFSCAREQADDHILHAVLAFDSTGKKLKEIPHCRNPRWIKHKGIGCDGESVDAAGKLALKATQIELE